MISAVYDKRIIVIHLNKKLTLMSWSDVFGVIEDEQHCCGVYFNVKFNSQNHQFKVRLSSKNVNGNL